MRLSVLGLVILASACTVPAPAPEPRRTAQALQPGRYYGGDDGGDPQLGDKQLVLTFDDGPGPRSGELSTYLKNEGIHAVFFVNGKNITAASAALFTQMLADGHLVANHTENHVDMISELGSAAARRTAVQATHDKIAAYLTWNKWFFRPPYGSWNNAVSTAFDGTELDRYIGPIDWDVGGFSDQYPNRAADWACWQGQLRNAAGGGLANGTGYATTAQCGDAYLAEITLVNHGIVLMHDPYGYANGNTVDLVKYLVPKLKAANYTFKRLEEVPSIARDIKKCHTTCDTCTGEAANQCLTCAAGKTLSGTTCVDCQTCAAGKYASAACTATTQTVCSDCTACVTGATYETATCTATADRACSACTTCAPGTYAAAACTAAANTQCAPCHASCGTCSGPDADDCLTPAACPAGQYLEGGICKTSAPPEADAGPPREPEAEPEPLPATPDAGAEPTSVASTDGGGCSFAPRSTGAAALTPLALALAVLRRRRRAA